MSKVENDDILRTEVKSLYALHLGLAIDEMRESTDLMKDLNNPNNLFIARRLAISSILHSFCSLEAMLNYLGYKRFFFTESDEYIPPDKRDYLLNRLIKSWDRLNAVEKINGLLLSYSNDVLSQNLEARVAELNNLRNWIAHGKTYYTVSLVEPIPTVPPDQGYYLVDEEISVKWKEKYPHCKFKEPHYLDYLDAQTALRVVIELFQVLSNLSGHRWFFTICYPSISANGIGGDLTVDVDSILGIK